MTIVDAACQRAVQYPSPGYSPPIANLELIFAWRRNLRNSAILRFDAFVAKDMLLTTK